MKKLFGFAMVALCAVCLTGCGSKGNQLKCTGEIEGQKATVTASLDSDKVTKVVMETVAEASSKDEATAGAAMINGMGSAFGVEGMTMSAKASGKKVTTTMTMDVAKMKSDDLESNLGTTDLTKDAFVEAMKGQGLTCK